MNNSEKPSNAVLKRAISQLEEPLVFSNLLHDSDGSNIWKFMEWDLHGIAEKFGDLKLPFRVGLNAKTLESQWECECDTQTMTMKDFLKDVESMTNAEKSYYFDYKYMHEWFQDYPEILSSIDWKPFGLDKQGKDSTLWIGSQGAHTNCHQDSYGYNLVAQTHGRKQWILFPPDCSTILKPTRIPYEESTVHSRLNFFSPSKTDAVSLMNIRDKARSIVLEPGQVLLVPNGWWHYVESISLAISVNIWLPLVEDCQSRLSEALVKLFVTAIGQEIGSDASKSKLPFPDLINLIETCINHCQIPDISETSTRKKFKDTKWSAQEMTKLYPNYVSIVPVLESQEFENLLVTKASRFTEKSFTSEPVARIDSSEVESRLNSQTTKAIVNAFCHPDVISRVTELLLKSIDSREHGLV